ncbi:hypothetical protein SF83666_b55690 (plasmid) [Sinorhizobium fredii CCBAU 83666]|nr:hypothetical protein SF83666_b55690 [Sinorhizobium fredii CCBAU 83666]
MQERVAGLRGKTYAPTWTIAEACAVAAQRKSTKMGSGR